MSCAVLRGESGGLSSSKLRVCSEIPEFSTEEQNAFNEIFDESRHQVLECFNN